MKRHAASSPWARLLPSLSESRAVRKGLHYWIRLGFLAWAVVSSAWLMNSVRTQGVPAAMLASSTSVEVVFSENILEFRPRHSADAPALVFLCGSGIHPEAYAPLLRPVAEAGHRVFVVGLPWRFAPLETHKQAVVQQVRQLIQSTPGIPGWVVAGHSLGGALTARLAQHGFDLPVAFALIGTTHPKENDLSRVTQPVLKVYATQDGVAPAEAVLRNRALLPAATHWVEVPGGNHSQFGHYGRQLFDRTPTIGREAQQSITRAALLCLLSAQASCGAGSEQRG